MEHIHVICQMRAVVVAMHTLEEELIQSTGIDLNEAMVICCIADGEVSATDIATAVGLRTAHTSKVIASLEGRQLLARRIDPTDKRRMLFVLTPAGQDMLQILRELDLDIPEVLRPVCDTETR